jgi:3,4-dihydroxy 2-butanone 4-phosphate synthase
MPVISNAAPAATTGVEPMKIPFEVRFILAVKDMRRGHPIILVDDLERENEADPIVAAERISIASMAVLVGECSGIVCLCLTEETCERLELPLMVSNNESRFKTRFTVSIEAREGITTGVSAADRVTTIRSAIANNAVASDLTRPGHVFPLRAAAGGLLERQGHTEGSVELARLAGLKPAAVLCELTNPNGTMAKGTDIEAFAECHNMVVLSIAELVDQKIRVLAEANE